MRETLTGLLFKLFCSLKRKVFNKGEKSGKGSSSAVTKPVVPKNIL